jgi:ubiquinone/menaquinone biosynthesis C-methylase UbiE
MASRAQNETDWRLNADLALERDRLSGAGATADTDWTAYAATYDMLLEHNPAYQQLLEEFENALSHIDPPQVIYDIGGGTGNYSQIATRRYPESSLYFVEPDQGMRLRATEKLSAHGNVTFIDRPLQELDAPAKADLVICAHALYTMPKPDQRLAELRKLLRPGGVLFLVDLGRPMNVAEWRTYLLSEMMRKLGIIEATKLFWKGREIASQNKAIYKAQKDKLYWTHSEAEIASAVEQAGFEIMSQKTVYRGYSDLLLCRAAP